MAAGRLRIFAYVTEPNARLYRAVLRAFVTAKERFRLHLRPAEVLQALRGNPPATDESDYLRGEQTPDRLLAPVPWPVPGPFPGAAPGPVPVPAPGPAADSVVELATVEAALR